MKNPRGGYHTPAYPEKPTYGLQDYEGKEKEERPPNLRSKRKRKRPPREGGRLPLDPRGRGRWGPGALGEPRTHYYRTDRFASRKRAHSRGVMLRLTPKDPGRKAEAGKTPPAQTPPAHPAHPKGKKTRGGRKDDLRSYITT
jgi:hypothetical protein